MDIDMIVIEIIKMQRKSQGDKAGQTTADRLIDEFFAVKKLFEKKLAEQSKN